MNPPTTRKKTRKSPLTVAPRQRYLGWDLPILPNVVEQLFAEKANGDTWNLQDLSIVLPSGLAQRRLGELLAIRAQKERKILYPPQVVTVGSLPERLYVAKYPFASDLVQQLAWMTALQAAPASELTQIVPVPPPRSASQQWLELAKIFSGVHRELASERLDFKKVIAALGAGHAELPRWQALVKIQSGYLAQLDALQLWDIQTARLCALDFKEPQASGKIFVVGCVDLNRTQIGFLEQVAEQVEVWIAAPESAQHHFGPFGNLNSATWQDVELDMPADALLVGNSPVDQAGLTCACLAELGDRYHTREVTLGVPAPDLIPELEHQLDQAGVASRFGPGVPLSQSEPALLLSLIGQYVDSRSFAAFAALIRHPTITSLLTTFKAAVEKDWLSQIDDYYQSALPNVVDDFMNEESKQAPIYQTVAKTINRWLAKLTTQPKPISNWVQPLLGALSAAYHQELSDPEDPVEGPLVSAASQLCDAVLSLRDIPPKLEPTMTVSELIDWLLRSLSGKLVPEPSNETAIELLGWLELALDDAPALIVTGMHDGVVPESVNSDAFLPNALRRQLGMVDNAHRYARDTYSMLVMLKSRQHVRFVVGKTNVNGDPLVPSRLLMACSLAELPDRVLHLVREDEVDVLTPVEKRWKKRGGASQLVIPRPADVQPPRKMSVTAFRDYLACPYRFYLAHVLRLRDEHDADAELDASMFGNLLHDTLQLLGTGSISRCSDVDELRAFLIENLHLVARKRFGPNPPAAVLIQVEQAEQRLEAFAPHQAQRAADGWEIRFTEQGVDVESGVMLGHTNQLHLIGRIDRIDYHPATDRWAIWDYKTSDNAKHPLTVHWSKKDGWKDLQLPLYLPVARRLGVGKHPSLGYIALPKQVSDTGFHLAEFTQEQLLEAEALSHKIASQVCACEFWPEPLVSVRYDNFARICQTNVQQVTVDPPGVKPHRHQPHAHDVPPAVIAMAKRLLDKPPASQPSFSPLLIRASAGTGKTFQLTNRLLQIILSGQDVDHILASTFTRKAAGEIMHRVLQRLAQGCVDRSTGAELAEHLTDVDTSAANCLAALRRTTRSLHRLRIGTLDSFFAQVARTFSLEMGLPPGWNALDPVREPQMQMRAIAQMLDSHDRQTLMTLVRMLAKGESGRQVASQILQTVSSGYAAYRASSSEAWDQLPLPPAPSESAVESALRTLERTRLGHKSADANLQKLLHEASIGNWEAVISHGIYAKLENDPPTYYGRELEASLVVGLELLVQRAAAELLPLRRDQTLASYKLLHAYDQEYTSLLRRQRSLAFSDITYYLSHWMTGRQKDSLASDGRAQQIEFRLDCGVHHLLLDEFQDTAPEQWQILRPLAKPLGGAARSDRSFFCVGDTKQAIYGWRGGVAEIFDSVGDSVQSLQQSQMSDSFRSSPEVMHAVNQVFQNLAEHPNYSGCDAVAQRWANEFPEHRTSRSSLSGYVRLQNGPQVDRTLLADERKDIFLKFTAQQIADLTYQSSASVGVLFRTNADVGRMISLLRDLGVSASQDGGNPLTDSVAVELVLSLIHLADHPGDGVCAFHVTTSPLATQLPYSGRSHPTELANWFRREVTRRGLGRAVELIANLLSNELSWWDQHRLEQLIRAAYEYQPAFNGRLRDFEDAVIRARVALPTESQVKVMTFHKSKGLEFDAVYLPTLDVELSSSNSLLVLRGEDPCQPPDGILRYMNADLQAMLPKDWQRAFEMHKQRGVNESLCMLYVALTRARQALYITTRPAGKGALQDFSSLLQSTLGGGQQTANPEAILYDDGDADWFLTKPRLSSPAKTAQQAATAQTLTDTQIPCLKIKLRIDAESAPARGLRIAAPSSMGMRFEPIALANVFSFSHSFATTYGALIHAFFEQVRWLEDYQLNRDTLRRVALSTIDPESLRHLNLEQTMDEFSDMLDLPSIRSALTRNRYRNATAFGVIPEHVEVDTERAISLVMENRLVTGTIDRLVVLFKDGRPYAAEIIDFKTDKFEADMALLWLDDRVAHHQPQLEVYARVVAQLFDLPREQIATYLLMLGTDDLIRCDSENSTSLHDIESSTIHKERR